VFCALHDQLASLDRHAQLTRCFSAAAELLVVPYDMMSHTKRKVYCKAKRDMKIEDVLKFNN